MIFTLPCNENHSSSQSHANPASLPCTEQAATPAAAAVSALRDGRLNSMQRWAHNKCNTVFTTSHVCGTLILREHSSKADLLVPGRAGLQPATAPAAAPAPSPEKEKKSLGFSAIITGAS